MVVFRQEANSENVLERSEGYTSTPKTKRKYFKENYIEAMEIITPAHYFEEQEYLSEGNLRPTEQLINSHILFSKNISSAFPILSVPSSYYLDDINSIDSIHKYFVKQNNLTKITPISFLESILIPFGKTYGSFNTIEEFRSFLSDKMPTVTCRTSNTPFHNSVPSGFGVNTSSIHEYLTKSLSWLYFLNRPDTATFTDGYSTSGAVIDLLTERLTRNRSIGLSDCIKILQSYLWYNHYSTEYGKPASFAIGVDKFTSGTLQLEKIKTLVDIVYSPDEFNSEDYKVKNAFSDYINLGALLKEKVNDSSFYRFMEAVSFYMADVNSVVSDIETLTDIDRCPDKFLPYLADLIGWELLGHEPFRWRIQLKEAVEIYKAKGTKKAIKLSVDMMFNHQNTPFNINNVITLWESYLPNLILYALATESSLFFNGNKTFTQELATSLGIHTYDLSSADNNIRSCVDKILLDLLLELPDNFNLRNKFFPGPRLFLENPNGVYDLSNAWTGEWNIHQGRYYQGPIYVPGSKELNLQDVFDRKYSYRGKVTSFPPFEIEKAFFLCSIDKNLINLITRKLKCFGVREGFISYLKSYVTDRVEESIQFSSISKGFLLFTKNEVIPENYEAITKRINKGFPDPVNMLSLWSEKSSHFKVLFNANDFDFTKIGYSPSSGYAVSKIFKLINKVVPAHAISDFFLNSTNSDSASALKVAIHPEAAMLPVSYAIGSGQFANNYIVSSWSMSAADNKFLKKHVLGLSGLIFSGGAFVSKRSTLRRRNLINLLERSGYSDRVGLGVRGYIPLSGGMVPTQNSFSSILGYIPSAMKFQNVALTSFPSYPMTNILDHNNIHPVWSYCENYNSINTFFGINSSSTYPCRGPNAGNSLSASMYRLRDDLSDIMALQHRVLRQEKIMQAQSILSPHFIDPANQIVSLSSVLDVSSGITPLSLSSWVSVEGIDLVGSIANKLEEKTISDTTTNKYDNFKFGYPIHRLYRDYTRQYSNELSSLNVNGFNNLKFLPNIISHIYGPYIYNAALHEVGTASSLISSAVNNEIDISFGGGKGYLSNHSHNVGTSSVSGPGNFYIGNPEFYNNKIVDNISLIDTSGTEGQYLNSNVFSVFKFKATNAILEEGVVPLWARDDVFVDNLAIKYKRPLLNSLPRVRVTINPASNNYKNFLLPEHRFKIKINAANLDHTRARVGGDALCALITTEVISHPITLEKFVWVYHGGRWVSKPLSLLQSNAGIDEACNVLSIRKQFQQIENIATVPEPQIQSCISYKSNHIIDEPDANSELPRITNDMFQTLEFEFDTINPRSDSNYINSSPIHTAERTYNIDFFLKDSSNDRFVIFNTISIEDLTNRDRAVIVTEYGNYNLSKREFQTCFKFFNDIKNGLASKDHTITSSIMDVSGGSRASYRVNEALLENYITSSITNKQITEYNIRE